MRKRRLLIVLVAVVLIGAFVLTGVAIAGPRGSSTFTLILENSSFTGLARGDLVFTDRFWTEDGTPIEGWGGGSCVNLSPDPEAIDSYLCSAVYELPDGDLTFSFALDFTEMVGDDWEVDIAITGGTGAFRNVRGELILTQNPDNPDQSLGHFHLIGASATY